MWGDLCLCGNRIYQSPITAFHSEAVIGECSKYTEQNLCGTGSVEWALLNRRASQCGRAKPRAWQSRIKSAWPSYCETMAGRLSVRLLLAVQTVRHVQAFFQLREV